MAESHLRQMAEERFAFVRRHKGMGFADWPRAILLTMYRFAWPKPFTGETYLIASAARVGEVLARGSIWHRFAPNLSVAVASQVHEGILGEKTAAKLEEAMAAKA